MRLLAELLMLPLTGPVRGLRFIAEQVQAEMDAVLEDEGQLEAQLIDLSLRHDMGQISGADYEVEEAYLLERLEGIRAYQEALLEDYQAAYDAETQEEDELLDESHEVSEQWGDL